MSRLQGDQANDRVATPLVVIDQISGEPVRVARRRGAAFSGAADHRADRLAEQSSLAAEPPHDGLHCDARILCDLFESDLIVPLLFNRFWNASTMRLHVAEAACALAV